MSDECFFDSSAPGCPDDPNAGASTEAGPPQERMDDDGGRGKGGYEDWDGTGGYPMAMSFEDAQMAWLGMALVAHIMSAADLFFYKWQIKIDGTDADDETEERIAHFNSEYAL